jgi:SAM-dependent methyltransferase
MTIEELLARRVTPSPWAEGDNIPWDEPAFSQRMLEEHLSQTHDRASRPEPVIEAHSRFIQRHLRKQKDARILDLCCGPGLYLHRLARLGHRGHGIDFSPAAIAYAREVATDDGLDCTFEQADLREASFGEDFDLALLIFGQLNVFERDRARDILQRAHAALVPGGTLLLEPQEPDAIRGAAEDTSDWSVVPRGLFASTPHLLLHERFWDEPTRTATDRWYVVDAESAAVRRYAMSTCSYTPDELSGLLTTIGFKDVGLHASLAGQDEPATPGFFALVASR